MQIMVILGLHGTLTQTYRTTSVDRLLTQSKERWFYHGSIFIRHIGVFGKDVKLTLTGP